MPETGTQKYYRKLLETRLKALEAQNETNADSRNTVVLDQSSVGRLSRMDALQQQAMAKATSQNRATETLAIRAALNRISDDEFGYCQDCGEDIPPKRLELNPAATKCVGCAGA